MVVSLPRTKWAELQAEALLSIPFITEFVFRSPQKIDTSQKEVADLLITHKDSGLLVSQKAQEDPLSRDETKNESWVLKASKKGVNQLVGALRPSTKPIWCDHPRLGRVDFPTGLPPIAHGLVTVETFRPVDMQSAHADLPLNAGSVPITYMSLNDFFNVATQLRTVPELMLYLEARRELPEPALRKIGDEHAIFEYYLLHGTLRHCTGHDQAREAVAAADSDLDEIYERFEEYHYCSSLLEQVADALATRSATCLDQLPANLRECYDGPADRKNYVLMQEVVADLPLLERAALGRQFATVIDRMRGQSEGYVQAAAHLDSRPEWVFVFGSSKRWPRVGMLRCIEPTMRAALAHYQKEKCMIVIDRDGEGYEVAMTRPGQTFIPAPEDVLNGKKLFGNLRMASVALNLF